MLSKIKKSHFMLSSHYVPFLNKIREPTFMWRGLRVGGIDKRAGGKRAEGVLASEPVGGISRGTELLYYILVMLVFQFIS